MITKGSKECSGGWGLNVGSTIDLFLNVIIFLYKICNRSLRGKKKLQLTVTFQVPLN